MTHIDIYNFLKGYLRTYTNLYMYFYMYKYMYIFRDLESGLSKSQRRRANAGGGLWQY